MVQRVDVGAGALEACTQGSLVLAHEDGWAAWVPAGADVPRQPQGHWLRMTIVPEPELPAADWPLSSDTAHLLPLPGLVNGLRLTDVQLPRGEDALLNLADGHPAALIVLEGALRLNHETVVPAPRLAVLGASGHDVLLSAEANSRAIALG